VETEIIKTEYHQPATRVQVNVLDQVVRFPQGLWILSSLCKSHLEVNKSHIQIHSMDNIEL